MKDTTISFRSAKLYPFIAIAELRDMLNTASGGKATWTTARTRVTLQRAGALCNLPEDPDVIAAKVAGREDVAGSARRQGNDIHRKTKLRHYYTTPTLLLSKTAELYAYLIAVMSDDDVKAAMERI